NNRRANALRQPDERPRFQWPAARSLRHAKPNFRPRHVPRLAPGHHRRADPAATTTLTKFLRGIFGIPATLVPVRTSIPIQSERISGYGRFGGERLRTDAAGAVRAARSGSARAPGLLA